MITIPTNVQRAAEYIAMIRRMDRHHKIITATSINQGEEWDAPVEIDILYKGDDVAHVYKLPMASVGTILDDYSRLLRTYYDNKCKQLDDDDEEEFDACDGLDDNF